MEYKNLYIILIVLGITIFGYKKLQEKKVIESKEHFYIFGSIIGALNGIKEFFVNFPDLFMIMVDAMINFFLSFVDIILTLVNALEWIINLPMWVIEGFFFIVTLILDVILLLILYLNPITMMKGIVKMLFFMIKLILVFIFDMVKHVVRQFFEFLLDKFRDGLWGIPHGPDKHVEHIKWGRMHRPIDEDELEAHQHHHQHSTEGTKHADFYKSQDNESHGDINELHELDIYKPLRCYKGIGANGYLNIIAMIICPPLGVFMSYGLQGWMKIIVCAGLSLLYYFPGLVYALLITTHLGLGMDIDTDDCGGVTGGYFVHGCEKRTTKDSCLDATIPYHKDKNDDKIKACIWDTSGDNANKPGGGTCKSKWFKDDNYSDLISGEYHPERGDSNHEDIEEHTFAKGETTVTDTGVF